MVDELLAMLELDQATAMVAFPTDHNNGSIDLDSRRTTSDDHQLPLAPADDQDQELIAALLEKLGFDYAPAAVPTKAESPRAAETGEEKRGFGGSNSATAVRGSKRTQSRRSRKPKIDIRSGRVGKSTIHHQQQRREVGTRFCASDQAKSRSAAAAAPRRHPRRSGPSSVIRGDPGSRGGAMRATARVAQSPAPTKGIGGSGRCCACGGCCGGAEEIGSPPRQSSCKGSSFSVFRRRARGGECS